MWQPVNSKYGVAIHNWQGNVQHGIELDVGDSVEILEECAQWYRGTSSRRPRSVGIFPKSYVRLKDPTKTDPVVAECTQVLREWSEIWKKLYVNRDWYKFSILRKAMLSLLELRRELLSATLTQDQTLELRLQVTSKIDWGNRKLCLDLVPRIGPLAVNPYEISISSLHHVHVSSSENAKASSSRGTLRRKSGKKLLSHHLYFCMRDFGYSIGDDAEVFFYLYDASPGAMRQISERFSVPIPKDGYAHFNEKLHSNCCVFTDLGATEINSDLYLVTNVVRAGKMLQESLKKNEKSSSTQMFRRPFGVGVLPLSLLLSSGSAENLIEAEEKDHSFRLFQCEEKDFYQLHEMLIKKTSGKYSPINGSGSGNSYGIGVSVKMLHGELLQAKQEQPLLFQGAVITRKIGFPDIIMPGDVRNDLFLAIDRGEFERAGKSTAKNIEVLVSIIDSNGKLIPDCFWGASGIENAKNQFRSMILYHNNSPAWNETIRLNLPIEKFSTAHVRFEFRHCSTKEKSEPKLFAFSFARLMEPSGAALADGLHELYVYKCEDPSKLTKVPYLTLRCSAFDDQGILDQTATFHRTSKECMYIRSHLISTKLTQNADILSILQWKAHPERIKEALSRVLTLRDEELVKFLQDVLDALFAIFSDEDGNSTEHSGTVFQVLVSIFSLLQSSKFEHFKPVMDEYIDNHFAAALVYKGLITSVQHLADCMTTAEQSSEPIPKYFDSLEYVIKLIIQSRKLFKAQATGGQYEDSFRQDLYNLFNALSRMLSVPTNEAIIAPQEALLRTIGVVVEQLQGILSAPDIGTLTRGIFDAVGRDASPRLIQAKLLAIKDLVSGRLFQDEVSRSIILAVTTKHLRIHLSRRNELKLCADILSEVLNFLFRLSKENAEKPSNYLAHDLNSLCRNILDILMQTIIIIIEASPPVLSSLVAVLLGLLQQLDESHYTYLFEELEASGELKGFLHKCLLVLKELVHLDWQVFPSDWIVMKLVANNIIRKALEEFAKPLVYRYLDDNTFDSQLWWAYFSLATVFTTQPCLQLEKYSETKQRKILNEFGDMRVMMGFQILSMWTHLNENKLHFIPTMVGPFLEITLVPELSLRKATLTVFYDMIECEQSARGSFRLIESELIDKLDSLINENKGDDEYRELFSTIILERLETENPPWCGAGEVFIKSVTKLLERLLDYRNVMQGDENRDKRMSCTVNLLNFYKSEIDRKEMYLRYIYKLYDLHLQAENYTEAGFTLKLYADMLSWSKETLTFAPDDTVGQQEWERKENLYIEILKNFDKGKSWEKGIPLCKELAEFYETKRFDFVALSNILNLQAKFFQNILTQIRPEPEYFRVGFYGMGFPLFVRNKQFIYRGLEYERIGAFTQRLQIEFPQAQILTKNTPPEKYYFEDKCQYIQISNVRPIPDHPLFKNTMFPVPEKVAKFYHVNDVKRFQHDRPVYKGQADKDKDNEFSRLWIERTLLDISEPLPNILRWFEIVDRSFQELTPVEFACETMENVAKELHELIEQYRADPKRNINPFSMRLQGLIDANVMGGISKYQDAFFTEEFRQSAEGKSQQANVQRLKQLMLKQVQILETALALHGNLAPEGVQPLHKRLLERFTQMKHSINGMDKIKRHFSESIVNTPLPPLPIEKRSMSVSNQPRSATNSHDLTDDIIDDHSNYHMMNFEKEEIYTRPSKLNGNHEIKPQSIQRCISSRDQSILTRSDSSSAPPVPIRPKSAGYGNYDSPEIPPKSTTQAPPLPPRGVTPDKRISNPLLNYCSIDYQENDLHSASMIKSPLQKYSVVNIPLEDQAEADHDHFNLANVNCSEQIEYRDSGISTASHDLNYAFICSDATRAIGSASGQHVNIGEDIQHVNIAMWQTDMNANDKEDESKRNPPPIPRKMTSSMNYGMNHSNSDLFKEESLDHIGNGDEPKIDDYCMPKISNANNH
ncbi:dedicator of cytokinesis protein 3 isoform X2 [Sitodiplosis mosellana]|uniref:dedicator of cytokinesis protein 3 isoform X2 n=1 Tax=Sitodiplosis mosellana TaxID=263140 RepID=UPI002444D6FA|nr:dedicator of cytokinesis protein 3 isoform X2 [Sitodiplosis mosellana]